MRLKIFARDQMFFPRLRESLREIHHCCAAKINIERRYLDRRSVCIKMESRIGVGAVVHAHGDRAEIHTAAVGNLACQSITKRLVAGPFGKFVRKHS